MKLLGTACIAVFAFFLVACDKVDSCLDSGGCWDKVDNVCRKSEPNAQELCDRKTSFSPKPWLEDYLALREHISKSYANLEYLIKYYKLLIFGFLDLIVK